jgi:hypothetical protein
MCGVALKFYSFSWLAGLLVSSWVKMKVVNLILLNKSARQEQEPSASELQLSDI